MPKNFTDNGAAYNLPTNPQRKNNLPSKVYLPENLNWAVRPTNNGSAVGRVKIERGSNAIELNELLNYWIDKGILPKAACAPINIAEEAVFDGLNYYDDKSVILGVAIYLDDVNSTCGAGTKFIVDSCTLNTTNFQVRVGDLNNNVIAFSFTGPGLSVAYTITDLPFLDLIDAWVEFDTADPTPTATEALQATINAKLAAQNASIDNLVVNVGSSFPTQGHDSSTNFELNFDFTQELETFNTIVKQGGTDSITYVCTDDVFAVYELQADNTIIQLV